MLRGISAFEMEMRPKIQPASPLVAGLCNGEPPRALTLLFHNSLRHVSMAPSWVSHSLPSHPNLYIYIYIYPRPHSFVTESSSFQKVGEGEQLLGRQKYRVTSKERERGKMKEEEEDRGRNTKGTGEQVTEIRRFFVARNN